MRIVRAYLRGESVPFDELRPYEHADAKPVAALGLADTAADSSLHWLPKDLAPVPVEVVATGPKVLELAGRDSDRVLLAVGADPDRVSWAMDHARASGATRFAAFVNVVTHPDVDTARTLGAGGLSLFARFSAMDGTVRTPIDAESEAVLHKVHDAVRHARPLACRLGPGEPADGRVRRPLRHRRSGRALRRAAAPARRRSASTG